MASSSKFVCFFLLTTLLFSLQTYARDSQFFSKVSRNRDTVVTTTTPTKENAFEHLNKQEEQPTFIPQTTETGYGLYGHETGLDPPSTTSTSLYNMDENNNYYYDKNNNNNNYENFNSFYKNNNENHEKNYVHELKGLSSTSYTNEPSKYINNNNNNYNNNNNNNNNNYNNNGEGRYYGAGYNHVGEKQGMSDTRFLENGKYYYDLNEEKKNNLNNNNYMSYSNNYNNNYNTNGYYGNKENNFEEYYSNNKNNNNNFYSGNGMQGYQNQEPEEEFDFDQP